MPIKISLWTPASSGLCCAKKIIEFNIVHTACVPASRLLCAFTVPNVLIADNSDVQPNLDEILHD